jgi:two-component system, LytTR family, response regulator
MEKIKTIVVDDEKKSRTILIDILKEIGPEIEVVGEAQGVDEAYRLINELHPQLVFLDIQMPGGNGFTLLSKWREIPFDVIFVTAFDQYALNAIKFSALDYILKPVGKDELMFAVNKAITNIRHRLNMQQQIVALLSNLDPEITDKRIAVHVHDKVKLINIKLIAYIESDDSYCKIKLVTNDTYTISKLLKDFEEMFIDNRDFVRIHKSCMINIKQIAEYTKGEPCIIEMKDGKQFEVSRRKKQEVLEKIKS